MEINSVHVASVELCQQLSTLSGWCDTYLYWFHDWVNKDLWRCWSLVDPDETAIPAYDLGYLLNHLPPNTQISYLDLPKDGRHALAILYRYDQGNQYCDLLASERAERLEDATCLLAITLFQQGILRKEV